jgi:TP901 family phage tail tape measure protein
MPSEVFQLYLLLTLKDYASSGLNRLQADLRATGKEGAAVLRTFEELRAGISKGMQMAGIGVGGVMLMRKGVEVAASFEEAITEMRLSIERVGPDGSKNLALMNDQMARGEALAVRLGNQLPMTTENAVQMLTKLRQGGMDFEKVLGGAGETVAKLAILTHEEPAALALEFARFSNEFKLSADETKGAANVFLRGYRTVGLTPSELMETFKYFQTRVGSALGLSGTQGAQTAVNLMTMLARHGIVGRMAGTETAELFGRLAAPNKKMLDEMAAFNKKYGISLQFYKGGKFLGIDNAIAQMGKLKVLTQQEQIAFAKIAGGERAMGLISQFALGGEKEWKEIIEDAKQIPDVEDQMKEKIEDFNVKLMNVETTLKNIVARGFMPLMDQLKPGLEDSNKFAGFVSDLAKAHPDVAKYGSDVAAISFGLLTVKGGITVATSAMRLLKIEALTTRGALSALSTPVKIAIIATELMWVISELRELKQLRDGLADQDAQVASQARENLTRIQEMQKSGQPIPPALYSITAQSTLAQLNKEGTLREQMMGGGGEIFRAFFNRQPNASGFQNLLNATIPGLPETHPFWQAGQSWWTLHPERSAQADLFKQRAPELASSQVMNEFVRKVQSLKDWPEESKQNLLKLAQESFPQSYKDAQQGMIVVSDEAKKTADSLNKLGAPLNLLPIQFQNAGDAAQRFSNLVNSVSFSAPAIGATPSPTPGRALGGRVLKGVDYVGGERGMELFTPDLPGWIWSNDKLSQIARMIGAGRAGWSTLVREDLDLLGQPASLVPNVLKRIDRESRGNPNAINLWDINAKMGHPSIGLMQVIGPTFSAYAGPLGARGIYDPLANIYAGLNYAKHRYQSVQFAMDKPGGYDRGGWLMPGRLAINNTGKPEAVLTPGQSDALIHGSAGKGLTIHVHLHGVTTSDPRELARLVAREVAIQRERA